MYLSSDDSGGGGFVTPNGVDGGLYQGDLTFGKKKLAGGIMNTQDDNRFEQSRWGR